MLEALQETNSLASSNEGLTSGQRSPVRVTLLGSTGSVGKSTLDIIATHPKSFQVEVLTAHSSLKALIDQALQFRPKMVVIGEERHYAALKEALSDTDIHVGAGPKALVEAALLPTDRVIAAILGAACLTPLWHAVTQGVIIGLANKEAIVCAGQLLLNEAQRYGSTIIPVDSEHSAIFQSLEASNRDTIEQIILTGSGGPFRTLSLAQMRSATPQQAISHPTWSMGDKISIDSATLMNKGLEFIEAHYLFDMPVDQIGIIIHRESIIHGMVSYKDGSVIAQLGVPDMRTPISYALSWPDRLVESKVKKLNLLDYSVLSFEKPDPVRFPALDLCKTALDIGTAGPTILNAANEIAVAAFLQEKIGFLDITSLCARVLEKAPARVNTTLEEIMEVDREARMLATQQIELQM